MKVLMLNTFDEGGGAARAAVRLLKGVRDEGVDAKLLVHFKAGKDNDIVCNSNPLRKFARRLKGLLGLLPVRFYTNKPQNNFSPALLPDNVVGDVKAICPDIIHLHWLCASFLQVETVGKLDKPIIWTLHDSWAFTGGCHVPFDCQKYQQSCGECPVLGSTRDHDLSRKVWERKAAAWRGLNLTVVSPSRWLAECARSSSLFRNVRVEVIPNGLDLDTFCPMDKEQCRNVLGLPQDRKIILFGAMWGGADPNKGLHLLLPALQALGKSSKDTLAIFFGVSAPENLPDVGMPLISLGRIQDDDKLAAIYSAADVFVSPSMLENLPNTILEAMACGTPCVAFKQGGVPELIDHKVSGYLAQAYDVENLAAGIAWVLEDENRHAGLSSIVRQKVEEEFALDRVARRYADLYREVLESPNRAKHD